LVSATNSSAGEYPRVNYPSE